MKRSTSSTNMNTRKNLQKKWERIYHNFRKKQIRRKKEHRLLRRKLSGKEYIEYRIYEVINGEWKQLVTLLATLLILILLCAAIIQGIGRLVSHISSFIQSVDTKMTAEKVVETESETEGETEPLKVYPVRDITIGSTGCMLLHSPFIDRYPDADGNYDFSSVFQYISPYYSKPDFMTCEYEGSLGGEELEYSGYPQFNSPDIIIENIKDSGVDLQFLATNHIYDCDSFGLHRTMDVYEEQKIAYTGIRKTIENPPYYIASINDVNVGFINYVYETDGFGVCLNGFQIEDEDEDLINTFDYNNLDDFYKEMEETIASMKKEGATFLIAQMHWGTEYELTESSYQDKIAQNLCNLGIDVIIGGHPHCEQPIEVLTASDDSGRQTFVVYSEGNALSNQRKELMDEMPNGYTEDGCMITLSLHQDHRGTVTITDVELLPTWVYRFFNEEGLTRYYILPLDDVEHIEETTGISGILEEAQASYNRTMEVLQPGLQSAKDTICVKAPAVPETEAFTESESESETEA